MNKIKLKCNGCGQIHSVVRTQEIDMEVKSLSSNWCHLCEDDATEEWTETHHVNEIFGEPDPNQLNLF